MDENLDLFLNDLEQTELLDFDVERSYLIKAKEGDFFAREELIVNNIKLVVNIAKKYRGQNLEFLDLIQEGCVGLTRAIDTFDLKKNNRLSTYATLVVKTYIIRAIDEKARMIKIPIHSCEELRKLNIIRYRLYNQLQREPNAEEISRASDFSLKKVKYLENLPQINFYIDAVTSGELDLIGNFIINSEIEQEVLLKILKEELQESFDSLDYEAKKVLMLRYGLVDDECLSQRNSAKVMQKNYHQLRKIEHRALSKMKKDLDCSD